MAFRVNQCDFEIKESSLGIGGRVWEAARIFLSCLDDPSVFPPDYWKTKWVLELGSGTGVCGISTWLCGANVCLTDLSSQMDIISDNVTSVKDAHPTRANRMYTQELDWNTYHAVTVVAHTPSTPATPTITTDDNHGHNDDKKSVNIDSTGAFLEAKTFSNANDREAHIPCFNIIIAVDCIYDSESIDAFLSTLLSFTHLNSGLIIYLVHQHRSLADGELFSKLSCIGWQCDVVFTQKKKKKKKETEQQLLGAIRLYKITPSTLPSSIPRVLQPPSLLSVTTASLNSFRAFIYPYSTPCALYVKKKKNSRHNPFTLRLSAASINKGQGDGEGGEDGKRLNIAEASLIDIVFGCRNTGSKKDRYGGFRLKCESSVLCCQTPSPSDHLRVGFIPLGNPALRQCCSDTWFISTCEPDKTDPIYHIIQQRKEYLQQQHLLPSSSRTLDSDKKNEEGTIVAVNIICRLPEMSPEKEQYNPEVRVAEEGVANEANYCLGTSTHKLDHDPTLDCNDPRESSSYVLTCCPKGFVRCQSIAKYDTRRDQSSAIFLLYFPANQPERECNQDRDCPSFIRFCPTSRTVNNKA